MRNYLRWIYWYLFSIVGLQFSIVRHISSIPKYVGYKFRQKSNLTNFDQIHNREYQKEIFILHPGVATPTCLSHDLVGIYRTGEYVQVVCTIYDYFAGIHIGWWVQMHPMLKKQFSKRQKIQLLFAQVTIKSFHRGTFFANTKCPKVYPNLFLEFLTFWKVSMFFYTTGAVVHVIQNAMSTILILYILLFR